MRSQHLVPCAVLAHLAVLLAGAGAATAEPLTRISVLHAEPPSAGAAFGWAVAGDGDTAVVGAYHAPAGDVDDAGAAFVYARTSSGWGQVAELDADDAVSGDFFGVAVALDGDTIAIGASNATVGGAAKAGAVYIYTRSGGAWSQTQKLTASDGAALDGFGQSVAIDGDTLAVGVFGRTVSGKDLAGSVVVFVRSGGTWTEQQRLVADAPQASALLGLYIDISGDSVIATAAGSFANAGTAHVFVRSGDTWSEQQVLATMQADGDFGVAIDGDIAMVGSPKENTGAGNSGAVVVFERSGTTWSEKQRLGPTNPENLGTFGDSIDLRGGVAAVGAPRASVVINPATGQKVLSAGSAYRFELGDDGKWSQTDVLASRTPAFFDLGGSAVALVDGGVLSSAISTNVGDVQDAGTLLVFEAPAGLGASCSVIADCADGHCAGGVCCDAACDGGVCQSCRGADTGVSDGTCALVPASAELECRSGDGACDPAETCDGANAACPADALAEAGTACDDLGDSTRDDACDDAGHCIGTTYECEPGPCEDSSSHNGVDCDVVFSDSTRVCDDGHADTANDHCDGDGACTGTPVVGEDTSSGDTSGAETTDEPDVTEDTSEPEDTAVPPEDTSEPEDTAVAPEDTAVPPEDTAVPPEDSTVAPEDSTVLPQDSTVATEDSSTPEDTVTPPDDTSVTPDADATTPADTNAPADTGSTSSKDDGGGCAGATSRDGSTPLALVALAFAAALARVHRARRQRASTRV